ncbi:MAG: hypothetical protein AAB225_07450 [Acidobacteriota bacterium]
MKKLLLAILITLSLGAATLAGADFWQTKKFTEWTPKETQKILNDSPWARPIEIRMDAFGGRGGGMGGGGGRGGRRGGGGGGMGGGMDAGGGGADEGMGGGGGRGGGGTEGPASVPTMTAHVRWHTALPVKQAVVRARLGNEAGTSPEAAKTLSRQETAYIVGIGELPPQALGGKPAELKANAQLRIKGQPPIQALDVKPDKGQRGVILYLFFPKGQEGAHVITLEDNEVEVFLKLRNIDIKRKFKLKDMVFDGKLEI